MPTKDASQDKRKSVTNARESALEVLETPTNIWTCSKLLEPGNSIERFTLETLIGRGSMGLIWKAYDPQRNASVVLKLLSQTGRESEDASTRYKKAFENIHSLNHQNICPVYDLLETEQLGSVLVMKLIEGTSLANAHRDNNVKTASLDTAIEILRPIAAGLDYCHSKGVIHRDVKPENIIVENGGTPILVDFEFATSAPNSKQIDPARIVAGSRNFISPEIAAGAPATPRSDQYSLAVSFLLLVSGKVPSQIWGNCFEAIPESAGGKEQRKNAALQIEKALLQNPASRFASCLEFIDACLLDRRSVQVPVRQYSKLMSWGIAVAFAIVGFVGWAGMQLVKTNDGSTQSASPVTDVSGETEMVHSPPQFVNEAKIEFVQIPAGNFLMGSPESELGHQPDETQAIKTIERPLYVSKYEVTQHQYQKVMNSNPSNFSPDGVLGHKVVGISTSRFPVENVTWQNAVEFCRKLTAMDESRTRVYRLPTEEEWEYFCRAGTDSRFCTGDGLTSLDANFDENFSRVSEVGTFPPNKFGLYDCHGNVWEWCSDTYTLNGKEMSHFRVVKGGSWRTPAEYCRSACRERFQQNIEPHSLSIGIRVVCEPTK